MGKLLASEGFDNLSYPSADDFFADPRARSADLIFLDLDLPGTSGMEAVEKLREGAFLEDVPLVIISGTTDDTCFTMLRNYTEDRRVLATEFYGKDRFSFDMLFVRMRNLLKMRDMYRELHPAV